MYRLHLLLYNLFQREGFSQEYFERLFGKDVTVEQAMAAMDTDGDGNVRKLPE